MDKLEMTLFGGNREGKINSLEVDNLESVYNSLAKSIYFKDKEQNAYCSLRVKRITDDRIALVDIPIAHIESLTYIKEGEEERLYIRGVSGHQYYFDNK